MTTPGPQAAPAKIVQIQIFAPAPPLNDRRGMLFALDDTGQVWWADFDANVWQLVATLTAIINPPPFLIGSGRMF